MDSLTDRALAKIDALTMPTKINFEGYYANLPESQNVRGAEQYKQAVHDRLYGAQAQVGMSTPWESLAGRIKFRPGEYSTWTGYKGHGKSSLISQCFLHGMVHGERCLVISPEFTVPILLARKLRQASRGPEPAPKFVDHWLDWCKGKLWFYDHQGAVKPRIVLGVIAYAVKQFSVTQVLIDSLMKCGIGTDDYNGQKRFVDELQALAHEYGPHIHLVTPARGS